MSRCYRWQALVAFGIVCLLLPRAATAQSANFAVGSPVPLAAGVDAGVQAVALADVNKDGRVDIVAVAADEDVGPLAILLNQGGGTFSAPQFIVDEAAILSAPVAVAVDDFGSPTGGPDGNPDILVADSDGSFTVVFGDGAGGFTFGGDEPDIDGLDTPVGVAVGDFDGVNGPDFAIIDEVGPGDNGEVLFFCNQGTVGLFAPCTTVGLDSAGPMPVDVATGDFNNDNRTDLVVLNSGGAQSGDGSMVLFTGNGSGTFTQVRTGVFSIARHARDLVVADFNQDSFDDVAVATDDIFDPDNLPIFLGGTTGSILDRSVASLNAGTTALSAGNFAGNTSTDIAGANDSSLGGGGSFISVTTGDGTGGFSQSSELAGSLSGAPISMVAGRLNSDGLDDLVVLELSSSDDQELRIAINEAGMATRTPTTTPTLGPATSTPTRTPIPVISPGLESCPIKLPTNSHPQTIIRGDFSGNGDRDLAILDPTAHQVLVATVDPDKLSGPNAMCAFASAPLSIDLDSDDQGFVATALTSADFDGRGRSDIVIAGQSGLKMSLFDNDLKVFLTPVAIHIITPPVPTRTATPTVGPNTPTPTIGPDTPTPTTEPPINARSVATGDFDRNGIADLAVVDGSQLFILTGMGDGTTFCRTQVIAMPNGAIVVAAKLDTRGSIDDLAVASGNSVTILLSDTSSASGSCTQQNLFPQPGGGYPTVPLVTGINVIPSDMQRVQLAGEVDGLLVSAQVSGSNKGKVFLITNTGQGFKPTTTLDLSSPAKSVASGDFVSSDGRIDIATSFTSNSEGMVAFFAGQPDGTFASNPSTKNVLEDAVGADPTSLVSGFFDNDDQIDLAVVNRGDGSVTFFLSSRVPPTPIPTETNTPAPTTPPTQTSTPGPTNSPTITPRFTAGPTETPKLGAFSLSSCSIAKPSGSDSGNLIALLLAGIAVIRLRRPSPRNFK